MNSQEKRDIKRMLKWSPIIILITWLLLNGLTQLNKNWELLNEKEQRLYEAKIYFFTH